MNGDEDARDWTTVHRCQLCEVQFLGSVRGSSHSIELSLIEVVATGSARSPMIHAAIHSCADGRFGLAPIIGVAPDHDHRAEAGGAVEGELGGLLGPG